MKLRLQLPLLLLLPPLRLLPPGLSKGSRRMLPVSSSTQALHKQEGGVVLYRAIQRACHAAVPCSCRCLHCQLLRLLMLCWHSRLCQLTPPQQVAQVELPGAASTRKAAAAAGQKAQQHVRASAFAGGKGARAAA